METYAGYAVGLDIGGTNVVAGVIAGDDGRVVSRASIPSESRRGSEDGLRRISALISEVIREAKLTPEQISGIGIGASGPVDTLRGLIQNPYTLPGWEDLPINAALSERFGMPCVLLLDTHVAALGEHWAGAGRGARNMVYVTFGTGIGAGIILNNALYRGIGLTAGEVGHHVIEANGPPCYCGGQGCWEMLAAAPAISHYAVENAPADSLLAQDRATITPLRVSQAAQEGDAFATHVMERTARYLGVGIANLITIFAPQAIVLGGGIMGSWAQFAPIALKEVERCTAVIPLALEVKISPAALGLNAGITGAARAVFATKGGEATTLIP